MKFLLIGATGLVGHGITRHLINNGHWVTGTSRNSLVSHHSNFHPIRLDLKSLSSITQLSSSISTSDCLIFNAAQLPYPGATTEDFYDVNVFSLRKVLDLCPEKTKVILISTTAILDFENKAAGPPPIKTQNDYTTTKIISELLLEQYKFQNKINPCILRIRAPYGYRPTQSAILPKFIEAVRTDSNLTLWGSGAREQLFTFVEDIGLACEKACANNAVGNYIICGNEVVSMKQLAELAIRSRPNSRSKIVFENKTDPGENARINFSADDAMKSFGFTPKVSLENGLSLIHEYLDGKISDFYSIKK